MLRRTLLLAVLATSGCGPDLFIRPEPHQPEGFSPWSDAVPEYRLAAGDRLRVQFRFTPELDETALVAPDGRIALRSAGRLPVAGLTVSEAEERVTRAARRVLRNPMVTLSVEDAAGAVVLVGGAVRSPGQYAMPARHGLIEAIFRAGGFEPDARLTEVVLVRRGAADRPMLRTVNTREFLAGAAPTDVPLAAGDIVFVPRSRIGEINQWIDQYVNRLVPFNRNFSYTMTRGATGMPF